jgi:hypothetical protein
MNLRSCRHLLLALPLLLLAGCPIPGLQADAGPDQVVSEGASVTLQASANVTQYVVGYDWTQTAGPKVKLKVSKQGTLSFTAPDTEVRKTLTFRLIVRYQRGFASLPDTVDVTVNQIKFFGTAAGADTVRLAAKVGCASGDTFPWLHNNTTVAPSSWTQLSGNLVIPAACTVVDVAIFFEGTTVGSDVFLDDVSVTPL